MRHFQLDGTVSRTTMLNRDDVVKSKIALRELGYYDIPDYGLTDISDEAMFDGIKEFQKDKGLFTDSTMQPGGETQKELNKALPEKNPFNSKEDVVPPKPKCPEGKAPLLDGICIPGTDICYYWWRCVPFPGGDAPR